MNDSTVLAGVETIYVVQAGDSLSKIAIKFYGDVRRVDEIAARNGIDPQALLFIGRKLVLPAAQNDPNSAVRSTPASPGGTTSVQYDGDVIETVTATASRLPSAVRSTRFWEDWRFWLAIGGAAAVLWFFSRRRN